MSWLKNCVSICFDVKKCVFILFDLKKNVSWYVGWKNVHGSALMWEKFVLICFDVKNCGL